jgi:replicative DNA helicase
MIEARTFERIIGVLKQEDFYNHNNKVIFETISKLYDAEEPYDLLMVYSSLQASKKIEQAGGFEYLTSLTDIIPNASNIIYYANQVRRMAQLRNLISTATSIHEVAYEFASDTSLDAATALDQCGQMIFELANDTSSKDPKPLSSLVPSVYEELEKLYNRDEEMTGITSGFIDLDKMTNGLQPSALIIIAGRPAMGKTSFALNVAQNAAVMANKTVAVFSLEMSSSQLIQRMISYEAEIPGKRLQNGRFEGDDWPRLAEASNTLTNMKIFIDDTSSIPVMEIRAKCRRMKANKEHGLDLVVIDYLQLMENKRIENREQQISDISRNLKGLAKELNVPVIALSQLNRSVETRSDKRPMPSDLRESGAIEQDADLIMFIYRDEVYNKDTADKGVAEIIVGKNRNGPTGTVRLGFQNELTKFRNLDRMQYN